MHLISRTCFKIFKITNTSQFLSDEMYLKLMYCVMMGKMLNLKNPKTFNEKLQWLKLHDRKPIYTTMVDKYAVKKYVAEQIGKQYIIPTFGVWDCYDDIDFEQLPDQFVLKTTHDSGGIAICKDKKTFDFESARIKLTKSLNHNYYYNGREWPYKNVKPRIICEKFISDKDTSPNDYKVLCFNGKAKLIEVHLDRFGDHKQDFYDEEWNKTSISQDRTISDNIYEKPKEFEDLIKLSEKLAYDMYHVRIDWFIVNHKLYFGEITFFDGSGFYPFDNEEDDYLLGSWINLPIENRKKEF